jgi:hypothetical protein
MGGVVVTTRTAAAQKSGGGVGRRLSVYLRGAMIVAGRASQGLFCGRSTAASAGRIDRITLGKCRIARYEIDAAHPMRREYLRCAAVDSDTPRPVPIAIYATRHAGHFGKSASIAPGTIHPAMRLHRRINETDSKPSPLPCAEPLPQHRLTTGSHTCRDAEPNRSGCCWDQSRCGPSA